ncbi:hypothetical protein [Desulfofustis limnaeus]|jgi:hypothetical protein|uniref:Uncharacterized protein n=1 Tax=Desulfofustis limnaeus TaxID=2740163 RepID=A0ABN6M9N9_9BACT|nr:hypothetical protein [Desulfofustis limnaeus]MDX9895906.1 hypothetical protein [Desulfofustis sp.]BDD88506.1 hypothetical protein DPPLL_28710 [Desulfofustis limnaeus]
MIGKKDIVDNELIKEIITIRFDTLCRMLEHERMGFMPGVDDEGATGRFDNKGAIFIPGGLIYQDVDERFIRYEPYGPINGGEFRRKIRDAMRNDNATLLYPDGIAPSVNLDSGFFSKAARRIFTYKKAAHRRSRKVGTGPVIEIDSDDIIKSHCPTYMKPPYGARTRISSCISVGLIEPPMFFAYYKTELNFSEKQTRRFMADLDRTRDKALSSDNTILYPPYVVVCHDTRYKSNNYTGLTRILGIGRFGEFATFTFESVNKQLAGEMKRRNQGFTPDDIFAEIHGLPILGIIRIYNRTNPGKRLLKYQLVIVSPKDDVGIDVQSVGSLARKHYQERAANDADTDSGPHETA